MRSVHIILAVHVSYSLAHFLELKSATLVERRAEHFHSIYAGLSGCTLTSIRLCYQCTRELRELNDTLKELPQLFSFRVDCRGATGDFQNLTLFESEFTHPCGHLTYRKYGNSSVRNPSSQWLPFISAHMVTMEKGDVLDFQCVLRRVKIYTGLKRDHVSPEIVEQGEFNPNFGLIRDGGERSFLWPIEIKLLYLSGDREPCVESLAKAYEWKMKVYKSKGLTYWVSYGSPVLQPQILPSVKFSSELRGEVYRLDKDLLHLTVMEATSYNSWKPQEIQQELVELDDAFYGDGTENDHSFSVDFKLRVNPDLLRSDTKDVVVRLKLAIWLQGEPKYFNVTLPTNQDEDASKSSNWWPWLTFILVLLFFLTAMAYVFREQLFMSQAFQLLWRRAAGLPRDGTGVSIEMQS